MLQANFRQSKIQPKRTDSKKVRKKDLLQSLASADISKATKPPKQMRRRLVLNAKSSPCQKFQKLKPKNQAPKNAKSKTGGSSALGAQTTTERAKRRQ